MRQGLLWYDDDPGRDLEEKVARAARRYREKMGCAPDTCYVHPSALAGDGEGGDVGQIHVAPLQSVLQHHLWLGREERAGE